MSYPSPVLDHFENPRNVGSLPEEDPTVGTARLGAAADGGLVKLQVQIDPLSSTVAAVAFKAFGCGWTIACLSFATERLVGKTLAEASADAGDTIADQLELPPERRYCAVLATDAVRAAIADYQRKNGAGAACAHD